MRTLSAALVAVSLGACAGGANVQPVELSGPAPAESNAVTMECVTRELENMGYEVPAEQTSPTQVTGVRINERIWFLRWIYGNTADQITASLEDGQLRVTAASSDPDGIGEQGPPTRTATEAAMQNAESIVETCAGGT